MGDAAALPGQLSPFAFLLWILLDEKEACPHVYRNGNFSCY
jgi:hypothetical protein